MKILFAEPADESVILGSPMVEGKIPQLPQAVCPLTSTHAVRNMQKPTPVFFKPLTKTCLTLGCGKLRRGDAVFHSQPHMDV